MIPGGGFMFNLFPILFGVTFIIILGFILFTIIKGLSTWRYNNSQPILTVAAKVVTKRTDVSRRHHSSGAGDHHHHHHHTSTTYYVTFEVESGDRMEFNVGSSEYGMLVEGDIGRVTFQGSRYHGFERMK